MQPKNESITHYLSFWSLEPVFVNDRLRYHLGQIHMLERLKHILINGDLASAIICDPPAITESRYRSSSVSHRGEIDKFLRAAGHAKLGVFTLSKQIEEERKNNVDRFENIRLEVLESYSQIYEIIASIKLSEQALHDLDAYRQPTTNDQIVESIRLAVDEVRKKTSLPYHLIPATLFAFKNRASWFEANSLASTAAYLSSFSDRSKHPLKILEAQRNSYSWEVLTALFQHASIRTSTKGLWPTTEYVMNVPAIQNNTYMRLASPDGCIFLDTSTPKLVKKIRELPEETIVELSKSFKSITQSETTPLDRDGIANLVREYRCRVSKVGLTNYSGGVEPECSESVALILKGGGVKGLAVVGAIRQIEGRYKISQFFGTSAGAILAVLLAAGYSADELSKLIQELTPEMFSEQNRFRKLTNLWSRGGIHSASKFEKWFEDLLSRKLQKQGMLKMYDLPRRAVIFSAQKGEGTFVFDSQGENRDAGITNAVRSSMSIPIFFTPTFRDGKQMYDGGILNNYPLRQFQRLSGNMAHIGIYLIPTQSRPKWWHSLLPDALKHTSGLVSAQDEKAIVDSDIENTILIDTGPIGTTDFNLTKMEKEFLLGTGDESAQKFLYSRGLVKIDVVIKASKRSASKLREVITNRKD